MSIATDETTDELEARCSEDMQDFYHIGNQIDADISKSLGINEE